MFFDEESAYPFQAALNDIKHHARHEGQGNYNFRAQIVLKATGKETYQTHCMWPLPKVCDGENNSAVKTYTKNITGTLSGNTIHTGSASIEWKPKFANQSMGGLQTTFVTNNVSVSLVGFSIEPQN